MSLPVVVAQFFRSSSSDKLLFYRCLSALRWKRARIRHPLPRSPRSAHFPLPRRAVVLPRLCSSVLPWPHLAPLLKTARILREASSWLNRCSRLDPHDGNPWRISRHAPACSRTGGSAGPGAQRPEKPATFCRRCPSCFVATAALVRSPKLLRSSAFELTNPPVDVVVVGPIRPRIASPPRARRGSTYSPLSGRDDDDRQASRRDSYRREHRGSSSRSRDFDRRGSYPTPPVNVQQPPRMSVLDTREPAIDPAAHQHGLVGTPRAPPPMMQHSYRSPPAHYEPRTPSMHTTTAASTPASASTPFFTIAQSMDERGRSTSNDPLIWGEKGEPWKRASAVSATGVDKQRSSQYSRKPTAQRKDRRCLWIGLVCLAVLIVGGAVGAGVGVAISKHHHDPNRLISGGDDAGVSGQSGLGSASGSDQPDAAPVNTTVPASAANGTTYKTGYSSLVVFGAS